MMRAVILLVCFATVLQICPVYAHISLSQPNDTLVLPLPKKPYTIGLKVSEPFIIKNGNSFSGLSITLWENIAEELNIEYSFKEFGNLKDLMASVKSGDTDVSINPLTVTSERLLSVEFTQPFFVTNLAIAVQKHQDGPIYRFIRQLFSWQFFTAVGLLFLIILIFGFLAWLFERKTNKSQFSDDVKGLWESFWWSAVTMTTVGYGDKAPQTVGGRVIAIIWMFTAIIIISGYTASIASSLTVNELMLDINSVEDLEDHQVATLRASAAATYLIESRKPFIEVNSALEGLTMVKNGDVEAFVFDEPIMRYEIMKNDLNRKVAIAPTKFFTQYYSFAVPRNRESPMAINLALIRFINSNEWKAELGKYRLE